MLAHILLIDLSPLQLKGQLPFKFYSFNLRNWVLISISSVIYENKLLINQDKFRSLKGLINLNYSRCLEVKCILSCWQRTALCGYFWWSIWCDRFWWQIVIGEWSNTSFLLNAPYATLGLRFHCLFLVD